MGFFPFHWEIRDLSVTLCDLNGVICWKEAAGGAMGAGKASGAAAGAARERRRAWSSRDGQGWTDSEGTSDTGRGLRSSKTPS